MIELKVQSRGEDSDAVRPIHLAQTTLLVDGQVEAYRKFRIKKDGPPETVSIMELMDNDGDGVVTTEEYESFLERQKEL
eukprot:COSAG05_NODE_19215_length_296_cov_0.771574_1_plen_78_part_01